MPNALDMFREQRDAAHKVHARLEEVAALLNRLETRDARLRWISKTVQGRRPPVSAARCRYVGSVGR